MTLIDGKGKSINLNSKENFKSEISPIFFKSQIIGHAANTEELFERYKADGLKFIECDLQKTADDVFITGHNQQETFNGEVLSLTEMTYGEIVQKGYPAFKLEDLVLKCKKFNMCLYLDIKFGNGASQECLTKLYKLIEKYSMTQSTVFGSLYADGQAVLSGLNDSLIFDVPMFSQNSVTDSLPVLSLGKMIIGHISASGKNPEDYREIISASHEKGFKIYPWTIGTTDNANEWFNVGADYVMCAAGVTNGDIA